MPAVKATLLVLLASVGLLFLLFWWTRRHRSVTNDANQRRWLYRIGIGAITDFLDTLGVGSFATTASLFRLGGLVADEQLPGTMNVGHALPTLAQALIYIAIIEVDPTTLVAMIGAATVGAYFGAGVVTRWPRRRIRIGMGSLLLVAGLVIVLRRLGWVPDAGQALGLSGARLWLGVGGNFALGALMTLGIGLYAPCMLLVSLLGMSPVAAFPIMMGSCAMVMPAASYKFISARSFDQSAALGLTLGGVPAVLVAAYLVKSLPLGVVHWLVVGIVLYTAWDLLRAAAHETQG